MKKEYYDVNEWDYIVGIDIANTDALYDDISNFKVLKNRYYIKESPEDRAKRLSMIREDKIQALLNNTEFVWKKEYDEPQHNFNKYYDTINIISDYTDLIKIKI